MLVRRIEPGARLSILLTSNSNSINIPSIEAYNEMNQDLVKSQVIILKLVSGTALMCSYVSNQSMARSSESIALNSLAERAKCRRLLWTLSGSL